MVHYSDLGPCEAYGAEYADAFRAVGWLGADSDYPKGHLTPQEHKALTALTQHDYALMGMFGRYKCEFCGDSLDPTDLFIPAGDHILLAPRGVLHYVEVHDYLPPEPFRKAVLECPPLASRAYFAALLQTTWAPIARTEYSRAGLTLEAALDEEAELYIQLARNPGLTLDEILDRQAATTVAASRRLQHPAVFATIVVLLSGVAILIAYMLVAK